MAQDGAALLKKIKPQLKQVRVHICLRPDLLAEFHRLESELTEMMAEDAAGHGDGERKPRLAEKGITYSPETQAKADEVQKVEKRIAAADAVFTLEALPKDEWAEHAAKNPPREGNHFDVLAGYNRDAALDGAVRMCLIDPVFTDCEDVDCDHKACGTWQAFLRVCASSEWEELKNGVSMANTEVEDDPKSHAAARVLRSSGESSGSRRSGESRTARSAAGRRARS